MTERRSQVAALDGLRAVAVLLVVLVHSCQYAVSWAKGSESHFLAWSYYGWSFGRFGVHLFFVLSGFLLFLPYAEAIWGDARWPDWRRFYVRRMRRVGPAYWVSLLVIGAVAAAPLSDVVLHLAFLHNATGSTFHSINTVYWSMAVEVQFYLLLPVLALVVRKCRLWALAALLCVTPFTEVAIHMLEGRRAATDDALLRAVLSTPAYLTVFFEGASVAVLWVLIQRGALSGRVWSRLGLAGCLVLPAAFTFDVRVSDSFSGKLFIFWNSAIGFGFAALLLVVLTSPRVARVLSVRALTGLGLISYSVYIWHVWLYDKLFAHFLGLLGHPPALLGAGLFVVVVILPVSYASFRLLERPFHVRRPDALLVAAEPQPEPAPDSRAQPVAQSAGG